jgi:hypothetical protein
MPSALLALTLSLLAAQTARAQTTNQTAEADSGAAQEKQQPAGGGSQAGRQQQQQQPPSRPAPLTGGEKVSRSLRMAFLRPTPYIISAFSAGITQLGEDRLPHKDNGDEVADWGSRTARSFATRTTTTFFASGVYPALFKQDPRYERSRSKKTGARALHAVSRVFVTRDDDGNLEPNYSRFAGALTSSALANVWERSTPGHDRIGADATFKRFGRSLLFHALGNVVLNEFGPDIIGIFRK